MGWNDISVAYSFLQIKHYCQSDTISKQINEHINKQTTKRKNKTANK